MRTLSTITDPAFQPKSYTILEKWILQFINDERDLPFIYFLIKITFLLIPISLLLYLPINNGIWWILAVVYLFANIISFKGPFGLMLHCVSHRPLFKKKYKYLNFYITWILAPFFGHTPETYFSHHMGMHHAENNMPEDESSTMHYQRDSIKDFIRYLLSFLFAGFYNLYCYLTRKKRHRLAYNALTGELSFFIFCLLLCLINFSATLIVFILPFITSRIIMMLGNWTQHAFVDPNDPSNVYKNSITCINIQYNHKCWNDGYHTSHHARPALHWTLHPENFLNNLPKYAANKSVVFENFDFLQIFLCLMRKRYDKLATYMVNINNAFIDKEEAIDLLKKRTQKFPIPQQSVNPVSLQPVVLK